MLQCTETVPQQWRAVDVERAVFRLASLLGTPPVPDDDEELGAALRAAASVGDGWGGESPADHSEVRGGTDWQA